MVITWLYAWSHSLYGVSTMQNLKFYKHLSQGGRGLCVHRTITEICLYTWMLHLQNIPPRPRRKPGEQTIIGSKSKIHNLLSLLLSRTNNSQKCDLTQADLTQNILTNPVQIQALTKWWENIQTKVRQPAGPSQGYPPESMTVTFSAMNNPQNNPTLNVVQAGTGCEQSNGGIKAE